MAAAPFCFTGIFRVFIGSVCVSENSSCDGESRLLGMARRGVLCLRRSGTVEDCLRTGRRPWNEVLGFRSVRICVSAERQYRWEKPRHGRGLLPRREVRLVRSAVVARYGATFRFGHVVAVEGCRSRQRADWCPASVLLRSQRVLAWGRNRFLYAAQAVRAIMRSAIRSLSWPVRPGYRRPPSTADRNSSISTSALCATIRRILAAGTISTVSGIAFGARSGWPIDPLDCRG